MYQSNMCCNELVRQVSFYLSWPVNDNSISWCHSYTWLLELEFGKVMCSPILKFSLSQVLMAVWYRHRSSLAIGAGNWN